MIGIEIHVQLLTDRKLFCGDRVSFGLPPNTQVCPVCLGLPGALPTVNPQAVELALVTATALACTVHPTSVWARKNYFYPDLPKGYQITQFERPLATGGVVEYGSVGEEARVRIRRIHMEEDAGKSVHDRVPGASAVDLNRAGTPLVEIVTEPDLRRPTDVRSFLTVLKQILEYAEVSNCNMEEGSLRADANVSIRPEGVAELGTKTEIKNVNSFSGIERALEIEISRQISIREKGGAIRSESLLWDDHRGELRSMRSKEESHDYRYFPDPDLPELIVSEEAITSARSSLPELPRPRRRRFEREFGLSPYEVEVLTQTRGVADFFEAVSAKTGDPSLSANWIMGAVRALANSRGVPVEKLGLSVPDLADLLALVQDGTISDGVAKNILTHVVDGEGSPRDVVRARGLEQVTDQSVLERWVSEVLTAFPEESQRFRQGEARLLGFLVGKVMQRSGGKADPHQVNELLRVRLSGTRG